MPGDADCWVLSRDNAAGCPQECGRFADLVDAEHALTLPANGPKPAWCPRPGGVLRLYLGEQPTGVTLRQKETSPDS